MECIVLLIFYQGWHYHTEHFLCDETAIAAADKSVNVFSRIKYIISTRTVLITIDWRKSPITLSGTFVYSRLTIIVIDKKILHIQWKGRNKTVYDLVFSFCKHEIRARVV